MGGRIVLWVSRRTLPGQVAIKKKLCFYYCLKPTVSSVFFTRRNYIYCDVFVFDLESKHRKPQPITTVVMK